MNISIKTSYKHPIKYINGGYSELAQDIRKAYVEKNCLKCDKFMGREHDFSECKISLFDSKNSDCPQPVDVVSVVDPKSCIECESV